VRGVTACGLADERPVNDRPGGRRRKVLANAG
jgi:hypothetical protein